MFGEKEAKKAMDFARMLRELDTAAEDISTVDNDMDFYAKTSEFIRTKYEPLYKDITAWFANEVEPVREKVMEALSTDLPDDVAEIDGDDVWSSVIETAQNHGPDYEFGELIPSPEEWEQDGFLGGPSGTLVEVALRLEMLGVNPFTEQQRRAMRLYSDELRKRAEIISKLADGEPVT